MSQSDEYEDFYENKDNEDNKNSFKKKRFSMNPQLKDSDSSYGHLNSNSPKKNSGKAVHQKEMNNNQSSNEYSFNYDYSGKKTPSNSSGTIEINSSSGSIKIGILKIIIV